MRLLVSASNRSLVSCKSADAPEIHSLMEERSTLLSVTMGWVSIALNMVGTEGKNVALVFSMVFITSGMSRALGTSVIVPRETKAAGWMPALAKTWKSGSAVRKLSSYSLRMLPNQAKICIPEVTSVWCVPTAALERPVVPPVNRISALSSGKTSTAGMPPMPPCLSMSWNQTSPACSSIRSPSFFSFSNVKRRRISAGRYSLTLAATTRLTLVCFCTFLTLS